MMNEKEKLIVLGCDCDDTLFFHDERGFREKDAKAIQAFQASGGKFGVVTGRSRKRGVTEITDGDYPIEPDFFVFSNGACLMEKDGTILEETFVPEAAVRAIYDRWSHRQIGFQTTEGNCTTQPLHTAKMRVINSADDFDLSRVYNVFFWMEDPEESDEIQAFASGLEGVANARNSETIDIYSSQNSKGKGLRTFAKRFEQEQGKPVVLAALGDSGNDLPMIEEADVSATFEGSPEYVKEKADLIVDGAWEIIDHLIEQ